MSFQLGWPHAVAAIGGAIAARRSPVMVSAFVAWLLLIVLSTVPLGWLWDHIWPLRMMQFPWRTLAVTASLQVLLAAGIYRWLPKDLRVRTAVLMLFLLPAVLVAPERFGASPVRHKDTDRRIQQLRPTLLNSFHVLADVDEFRPRTARRIPGMAPRGDQALVIDAGRRAIRCLDHGAPYRIACEVDAGPPTVVTINQFYFPGWRVEVDGVVIAPRDLSAQLGADGRMTLALRDHDAHRLSAHFDGPPGGTVRILLSLLLLAVAAIAALRDRANSKRR